MPIYWLPSVCSDRNSAKSNALYISIVCQTITSQGLRYFFPVSGLNLVTDKEITSMTRGNEQFAGPSRFHRKDSLSNSERPHCWTRYFANREANS
jgi:hypothetical protein